MYIEQIPKIDARRQLQKLEAASFPYMEEQDRKKVSGQYEKVFSQPVRRTSPQKQIDANWDLLRKGVTVSD